MDVLSAESASACKRSLNPRWDSGFRFHLESDVHERSVLSAGDEIGR